MRQAARTDGNQKDIVSAFRGLGCSVTVLSQVGHGVPDLLIGIDKVSVPVELKNGDEPLTEDQQEWFRNWKGSKSIVRTLEDAGILVKAIRLLAASKKDKEKK
jgi:hypothetical protein